MMPFRDFSFAVYTAPGVEGECLSLQGDHGIDVNILLFCAYAAVVAQVLLGAQDLTDIDQEVAGLRDGVIVPLRTCRRMMKQGITVLRPNRRLRRNCFVIASRTLNSRPNILSKMAWSLGSPHRSGRACHWLRRRIISIFCWTGIVVPTASRPIPAI
jgi:uncharacterized protein (TIGR02444 family)